MSLDGRLSAECADVLGVLGDFHLLDLLSEGCTISENSIVSALIPCWRQMPMEMPPVAGLNSKPRSAILLALIEWTPLAQLLARTWFRIYR
jgi:hypothetical protein